MRVCLLLLVFCSIEASCIPVEEFFPFGESAGDVVLDLGDDDSSDPIPLSPPFPLLGEHRTSLRVGRIIIHRTIICIQTLSCSFIHGIANGLADLDNFNRSHTKAIIIELIKCTLTQSLSLKKIWGGGSQNPAMQTITIYSNQDIIIIQLLFIIAGEL